MILETVFRLLSGSLLQAGVSRVEARELRRYRQFYTIYPQIRDSLTPELKAKLLPYADRAAGTIRDSLPPGLIIPVRELIAKLSFTHIAELLKCDDAMKRAFYEIECIRGNWSVRELQRQINSLYYERSGLSTDKKKLGELAHQDAERAESKLAIRDPYIFEFLGLKAAEVMSESALEDELLDELQAFLLELGHGFCFEARQKRILIGDSHNFVDLVFYHRILKCHVLVELKLAAFSHENIGQLNTYVSWYRKNMMTEGDNPPVGILLCTHKDHTLVEYPAAGSRAVRTTRKADHAGAGCRQSRKTSGCGAMPSPVCRTSAVTPTTVSMTLASPSVGSRMVLPSGSSPGQNFRAAASLMTITPGEPAESRERRSAR